MHPCLRLLLLLWLGTMTSVVHAQLNPELSMDTARWYNRTHAIREVVVATQRKHYSRKNNPAVEVMRQVIANKSKGRADNQPYCRYRRYRKLTLSANDVRPEDLRQGFLARLPGALQQVEPCTYNGRLIMPLALSETLEWRYWRRSPETETWHTEAERSSGIGSLFTTGERLTATLRDFFTDVDVYDESIRLLQHTFASPIADDAIAFYHYTMADTLTIGTDSCYQIYFHPANQYDFGFTGLLYVMMDGSWQLRRCELSLPIPTGVNFVEQMLVLQEFDRVGPQGAWMLVQDDMAIELMLFRFLQRALIVRNTRLQGYSFVQQADSCYSQKMTDDAATTRSEDWWNRMRPLELTPGERRMDRFMDDIRRESSLGFLRHAASWIAEKYIETGGEKHPNLVDIGPLTSMLTANRIDGLRLQVGAQTTALLHPQLFLDGFYARGFHSRENYYRATFTFSLNKKKYHRDEFPLRYVSFSSTSALSAPAESSRSLWLRPSAFQEQDDITTMLKWYRSMRYQGVERQTLSLGREEKWGLGTTLAFQTQRLSVIHPGEWLGVAENSLRTTSLTLALRYAPKEKVLVGKTGRRWLNKDAPVLAIAHTVGLQGVLGSQCHWNKTEAEAFRRCHLNSWGMVDLYARGVLLWNKTPFQLLPLPPASLSYVSSPGAFALLGDMELIADRFLMGELAWDMNGKLLNRIPFLRHLRWREALALRAMWGSLSSCNADVSLPVACHPMQSSRPYLEMSMGFHNIFRFFHVEYVRRLSYTQSNEGSKQGVRFRFSLKF